MFSRAALLAFALSALPALARPELSVKVTGLESVTDADNFVIKTIISNEGDETVTLLNDPNSVLTPNWKTNVFGVVSADGAAAKFNGMIVKWKPELAIAEKDFTILEAGKSIEIEQNLSGVYNFTASGEGSYYIDAKNRFQILTSSGEVKTMAATVKPHLANVSGKLASSKVAPVTARVKRAVGYASCSATQQSQVATAVGSANSYISASISYLNGVSSQTTRWRSWFGTYSAANRNTVLSHYNSMSGDPSNTTYNCGCTSSAYAYVYSNQPGYVYLCNAFWSAPNTGTDSKAGTIVHEQSHFTVNGGTSDYAYGQSAARSLANSSPSQAIQNADNHEYFAENTPSES